MNNKVSKQSFEDFLIIKGYIKYVLKRNVIKDKWSFQLFSNEIISSLSNLDYRYFHNSDPIIEKINKGFVITEGEITHEDRKGEICYGLNEGGKPPVLVYPRPRIRVKRLDNNREVFEDQRFDDSMFIALKEKTNEEIFEAMFDRAIVFKFDLTKTNNE